MSLRGELMLLCFLAAPGVLAGPRTQRIVGPRDPEIIDTQGYQKLVQQYQGKPLLVAFWATWCEPCRAEFPMLNELAKEYGSQGLNIVGVNLDDEGDLILMRRFLARYKPIFPNYRRKPGEEEPFRQAVLPGWNGSLPASFFYAKDGRRSEQFIGERKREAYETVIHSLLASGTH